MWLIIGVFSVLAALFFVFPVEPASFAEDFVCLACVADLHVEQKTTKV